MPDEIVNMHEAKTHLSRLVERVLAGEEIVIGRGGKPVAKLVAYAENDGVLHPFGLSKGKVWFADDWEDDSDMQAALDEWEAKMNRPIPGL